MPPSPPIEFESLPFDQAVTYFRSLGIVPTWDYRDLWGKEKRRAFTVAKLTQLDLLEAVHDHIDKAIAEGTSLGEFTESVEDRLAQSGWGGELSSSRLENIYRTNLASVYAAGEYEQMQESAASRAARGQKTYLEYNAVGDERTRDEHEARDGTVLPIEDPWWDENTPPLDYQCRCWITEHSEASLDRYGLEPDEEAPDFGYETVEHPATGERIETPIGVRAGFGGRNWDQAVQDELGRRLTGTWAELREAIEKDMAKRGAA